MDLSDVPRHRPLVFDKMEALIKELQHPETGVPIRSQKIFLSFIPSAFMGYDLVEWLMDRFNLDETSNVEAINLGNLLCSHGYFFPVNDLKNLVVKDDSSLYRFQSPYYWPWTGSRAGAALGPDNVEYAIYLVKRTLRNKQRHALDDYEQEALANLRRNLAAKWDFITMQAEEQVRLAKDRKKGDKIVSDSQERAYWRVARPPPGVPSALEPCPVPVRGRNARPRKRTLQQLQREIELLKESLDRTRVKTPVVFEALKTYSETFAPYDPWLTPPQPSNPWISDDTLFWQINSPLVEVPSEKRVQRWALSIEELVSDPTGLLEFTSFLRKEYSHENIRFWLAVMDLRRSSTKAIPGKLQQIYEEFLKPGAPCEINIDGATAEKVAEGIKGGSRYALDHAADHVYNVLLKKDCYPRFIRSDHFQRLLTEGRNVHQKKAKFFNFGGGQVKKKPGSTSVGGAGAGAAGGSGALSRRRGSDRSLSGSAHELALCAAQPARPAEPPPHSHSQSNLTDLRDPLEDSGEDVAPWEACGREGGGGARRRQDSAADSGSSSSELSAVGERRRLPQQSTLDGGLRGAPPPLRRLSAVEPRHLPPAPSPPRSPRPARAPQPAQPLAPAPAHPTPTISVSSAPDEERSPDERADDPPSVFASAAQTPTAEPEVVDKNNSCDLTSEVSSEVSAPVAGCSRADSRDDAPRTLARGLTLRETSPASSNDSREIGDLPGSSPDAGAAAREPAEPSRPGTSAPGEGATATSRAASEVSLLSSSMSSVPSAAPATDAPPVTPPAAAAPSPAAPTQAAAAPPPAAPTQAAAATPDAAAECAAGAPAEPRAVAPLAETEDLGADDDKVPSPPAPPPDGAAAAASNSVAKSRPNGQGGGGGEQKRNDVCPWEDENSCESDAPFVKTYATLGYL